jgi:hypothetical protein
MGMRFMQRKNEPNNKDQEERRVSAVVARKMDRNQSTNIETNCDGNADNGNINGKCVYKEKSKVKSPSSIILELASVVDMYGVGSDLVGRRSFGGFHKSVMNTWDTALKQRADEATRTKNTKNHITDEELLERYEKYVKGRGGVETDGSRNRDKKETRKRQRNG